MANDYREKILSLARAQPTQPSHVAKALGTNGILAGAMLSEMAAKGALRISALKVGGSPLYFLPGNDSQLERYIHVLNEKDQKTCTLLQAEGVLRDTAVDPLTRVSLRTVKDFARPLEVTYPGGKELFWKWHSLAPGDAEQRIKTMLGAEYPLPAPQPPATAPLPLATTAAPQQPILPAPIQQTLSLPIAQVAEPASPKPRPKRAPRQAKPQDPAADQAFMHVAAFFAKQNVAVLEHRMLRKGLHDFVVEMDTPLGRSRVHCRALSKAKVTDADLGDAYAEGQLRRLPTVVLTAGELTKSAQERLPALKGLGVKRV